MKNKILLAIIGFGLSSQAFSYEVIKKSNKSRNCQTTVYKDSKDYLANKIIEDNIISPFESKEQRIAKNKQRNEQNPEFNLDNSSNQDDLNNSLTTDLGRLAGSAMANKRDFVSKKCFNLEDGSESEPSSPQEYLKEKSGK